MVKSSGKLDTNTLLLFCTQGAPVKPAKRKRVPGAESKDAQSKKPRPTHVGLFSCFVVCMFDPLLIGEAYSQINLPKPVALDTGSKQQAVAASTCRKVRLARSQMTRLLPAG